MVFIFNDVLMELGDPRERLLDSGCPLNYAGLNAMTPPQIMSLVRTVLFENPTFARDRSEKAAALAALVNMKTGANALLCLRTPQVGGPAEMPLRLAEVALPVIGDLARRERDGMLTATAIDEAVWSTA